MKSDSIWLRVLAALSGTAYAMLLMRTSSKWSFLATALAALALLLYGVLRRGLLARLLVPRSRWMYPVAAVLAVSAVYTAKSSFYANFWSWLDALAAHTGGLHDWTLRLLPWAVALLALPMAFCYLLWFLDLAARLAVRLWRSSDFTERIFFLGAGILFGMMIVFSYVCTQAFYGADMGGVRYDFDLIYASDSGYLVRQDVFRNVGAEQNDLRQPLFGLFAMPFAQAAWLLSRVLRLPGYTTLWQIVQILLFLIALILLSRMMGLTGPEKALFLGTISFCWPTLIFVLTAEQYLMAVFYLVLLLYLDREPMEQGVAYIAATGSMLTSGIWFPLVTWDRDFKKFAKKTLGLCGAFFAVTALCGRLTTFLDMPRYIGRYGYYSGADVPLLEKLRQFVNFAGGCLLAPPSGPDFTTYSHVSWQLLPVTEWSAVGVLVLLLFLCGVLVSRRDRFTRLCAVWAGFSLLLLGLVGWGTVDNGLMLYSLYFGWAFAAMVFRLVDRALDRFRPVKLAVMASVVLLLCVWNVCALRSVLIFGSQFYPALGGAP